MKKLVGHSWIIAFLAVALVFPQGATASESISASIHDNEVFIEEGGQRRQLTQDGQPKFLVTLSPKSNRLVYRSSFKPYGHPKDQKPAEFVVLETKDGSLVTRVAIERLGRMIDRLEWIDDRWILIHSEYEAILDSVTGKFVRFMATGLEVAPDRKVIAFINVLLPLYAPPNGWLQDQELRFLVLETDEEGPTWKFHPIFPEKPRSYQARTGPADENSYHRIGNSFTWSPAGRELALIDDVSDQRFLVIVRLDSSSGKLATSIKKYSLGSRDLTQLAVVWLPDGSGVELVTPPPWGSRAEPHRQTWRFENLVEVSKSDG